ncbi:MAG: hypothetical protein ACR2QI_09240 [Woeseiaceae bacterium]
MGLLLDVAHSLKTGWLYEFRIAIAGQSDESQPRRGYGVTQLLV